MGIPGLAVVLQSASESGPTFALGKRVPASLRTDVFTSQRTVRNESQRKHSGFR